jgi:transcriptional regulator with XRE-family HTH domain
MIDAAGFGSRFSFAWSLKANREGVRQIPLARVGKRIADRMGRAEAFPAGTVSRWAAGKNVPQELEVILAAAQETGVDPGWLTFGEASAAPAPAGWIPPARPDPAISAASGALPPEELRPGEAEDAVAIAEALEDERRRQQSPGRRTKGPASPRKRRKGA